MSLANNVNSILIEGNMIRDPRVRGNGICDTIIVSCSYYKNNGVLEKEVNYFDIEIEGKLVKDCIDKGYKGRSVKIIGRLRQDRYDGLPHPKVVIVAESIEYKPKRK